MAKTGQLTIPMHGVNALPVFFIIYPAQQQSPIELDPQSPPNNSSYLFSTFYPQKAVAFFYPTTIYIRTNVLTSLNFGEIYTQLISNHTPAFRANEVRIRSHAEHKITGQDYYDLELQVNIKGLRFSVRNYMLHRRIKDLRLAFSFR